MPYLTVPRAVLGAIFVLLLQLAPVQAQDVRFVATFGNNANECFTDTPCRTLQKAHDVASPDAKIVVLDSGTYSGALTITKSIAIAATGVHAHPLIATLTPVTIDAGPDDVVYLDGLRMSVNLLGGDNSGIDFVSGGKLHVRNCTIRNFGVAAIHVRAGGSKRVVISDCTIADNKHGIFARGGSDVFLNRVTVEGNASYGVRSQGSGARVRINNSSIVNNRRGLSAANGGRIISFGNNAVHGNNRNGAPTRTVTLK